MKCFIYLNRKLRVCHKLLDWKKFTKCHKVCGWSQRFKSKNLAFHLEIKIPDSGGREKRPRIQSGWCLVWSFFSQRRIAVLICWWWSTVFYQVQSRNSHLSGNLRVLHAFLWWEALWRCWLYFSLGLGTSSYYQKNYDLAYRPCDVMVQCSGLI